MSIHTAVRAAIAASALISLSACASIREHRGFVMDPQLVEAIQVGVDNKSSVEGTLGRPTFVGQFSTNDWYYVSNDTRQVAFANPSVRKADVLHVAFDAKGNVAKVERSGIERVAKVDAMGGKTPTLGHEKSLIEELFGNVGTVGSLPGGGNAQPEQ